MELIDPVGIIGTTIGRYRIVRLLGSGGMAHVYLAHAEGPGGFLKRVAVKVLDLRGAEDGDSAAMFLDEARTAARISHPSVVTVFDVGSDGNIYWIAMEYLEGASLREVLERNEDPTEILPVALAAHVAADAATGLHAAHELRDDDGGPLGLVHRDVSPHNLFIGFDGNTRVLDFGIARVADRAARTRPGVIKGKFAYLAPEQLSGTPIDRRADVFALGIVLWESIARRRLFRGVTEAETMQKILSGRVEPPSTYRSDCPPALDAIVLKALSRDAADRHPDARSLSLALRGYLKSAGHELTSDALAAFMRHAFARTANDAEQRAAQSNVTKSLSPTMQRVAGDATSGPERLTVETIAEPGAKPARRVERTHASGETDISAVAATRPVARGSAKRVASIAAIAAGFAALAVTAGAVLLRFGPASAPVAATTGPAPTPLVNAGFLSVQCSPECVAFIVDDLRIERTALDRMLVPAGSRQLQCISATDRRRLSVSIRPNEETSLRIHFE